MRVRRPVDNSVYKTVQGPAEILWVRVRDITMTCLSRSSFSGHHIILPVDTAALKFFLGNRFYPPRLIVIPDWRCWRHFGGSPVNLHSSVLLAARLARDHTRYILYECLPGLRYTRSKAGQVGARAFTHTGVTVLRRVARYSFARHNIIHRTIFPSKCSEKDVRIDNII